MKKIIITGATSFIGINLINRLILDDYKIFAIIRPDSKKRDLIPLSKKVNIIELSMSEYSEIDKHIDEKCDVFISLAWNGTRGKARNNKELQKSNFENSILALKIARDLGCKKIISAGSQAEYGLHESLISEKAIENPTTQYGKYKLDFYNFAKNFCNESNMSFIEARIFSLYGPGDNKETMIINTLMKMMQNQICDLTLCEQMWNFMYIDDAIDAFLIFIEEDCESGVYNLGSNDTRKLKNYIIEMKNITKSNSKLNFGAVLQEKNEIVNLMPDISKVLKVGFKPKVSFSEGILNIIRCENCYEKNICFDSDV